MNIYTPLALSLYNQLDGMEYEDSCTRLDLSFVPDSVSFDDCKIMSVHKADESSTSQLNYEPPSSFITTAVGQTNVKLTWEEEQGPERKRAVQKIMENEVGEIDQNLLAPPSDDDNDDDVGNDWLDRGQESESEHSEKDASNFNKYRALLLENTETKDEIPENDAHMEITWDPGLAAKTKDDEMDSDASSLVSEKANSKKVKKEKTNAKMRIDEKEDQEVATFRLMFGKDSSKEVANEIVGTSDPRFSSLLNRPEYHRDGTAVKPKKKNKKSK